MAKMATIGSLEVATGSLCIVVIHVSILHRVYLELFSSRISVWYFFIVFISLVKYSFCSLILFLSSLNCLLSFLVSHLVSSCLDRLFLCWRFEVVNTLLI